MNLRQALRADKQIRLALVGSGGKTTALFTLARTFDGPVLLTNSAHLAKSQAELADVHYIVKHVEEVDAIFKRRPEGVVLITGIEWSDQRLVSPGEAILERILHYADTLGLPLLIEADGSKMRPLKAPAAHEPPVPEWVNTVVNVVGLSGLGQPLEEAYVFRSDLFGELTGLASGELVTLKALHHYLAHPAGGLKNIPPRARRLVLLNQWDQVALQMRDGVIALAKNLMSVYDAAIIATLLRGGEQAVERVYEPVAGVVLAAGESKRFGQPKQLLDWKGKPFVRYIAEVALASGLLPVVVVLGAVVDPIRQALRGLDVDVVVNKSWQEGMASSVICGLESLPSWVGAVIFLLADQPQVTPEVIRALIELHAQTLAPIVAPRVRGRRANPVLFDKVTYASLMTLHGDVGGRALLNQFPVAWLDWEDEALLFDIDVPEDFENLRRLRGG